MANVERKQVVIYGCGVNGIHLYYRLRDNVDVLFFVDRSSDKHGYVMDGVICVSYEEFLFFDKTVKVIVSLENHDTVVEELKNHGFINVYSVDDCISQNIINIPIDEVIRKKEFLAFALYSGAVIFDDGDNELKEIISDLKKRKNV